MPASANEVCPTLGSWGDYWSVSVKNTTPGALAQPDTIVHGMRVTKAASYPATYQESQVTTAFFANSIPSFVTDLKDLSTSKLVGTKNDVPLTWTSG